MIKFIGGLSNLRTLKFNNNVEIYGQDLLDSTSNIFIRFYQMDQGFGFRFISFKGSEDVDPLDNSSFTWCYGPFKSVDIAEVEGKTLYKSLKISAG